MVVEIDTDADPHQEDPPISLDFEDVEEMDHDELREQYNDLRRMMGGSYQPHSYEWHEQVYPRLSALWSELRDRSDVTVPECPECGARRWGQNAGDPKICRNCRREVVTTELDSRINDAWSAILDGGDA